MERFETRWGGWPLAVVRLLVVLALWLPLPLGLGAAWQLLRLADDLPEVPDLTRLEPRFASQVTTTGGWHLAGADVTDGVAYEELPPMLIASFVASEDAEFFDHRAFSLRGIVRAALENFQAGHTVEGASTITQQVARQFLSTERSYRRKVTELLLARRLEAVYTKQEILAAYLGGVFLGHTAHGVTQGAWYYFGKPPTELSVPEMATLAGILPAPSAYNPFDSPGAATRERNRVLRRLRRLAMIDDEEFEAYTSAPMRVRGTDERVARRMPRAAESAIAHVQSRFGEKSWGEGGLTVTVAHDPLHQRLAEAALRRGVEALDRRQGWRGAFGEAIDEAAVDAAITEQPAAALQLARIVSVERREASLVAAGGPTTLHLEGARWAAPIEAPRHYKRPAKLDDLRSILSPGDLVLVEPGEEGLELRQWPRLEGAVVSIDSHSGALQAAVGSYDADRNRYDRALEGCRQPGSVFKPVVYAEALQQGLTPATMLSDAPTEVATGRGDVWQPRNADRDFKGYLTLANALAWSRNIPTVNLMDHLGPRRVVERAKALGITSTLDTTSSVSLGASCVRPVEMARVYAAFQREGRRVEVESIATISGPDGAILHDGLPFASPAPSTTARLYRMSRPQSPPARAISENVAYLMIDLLRRVVTSGTAHELPDDWAVAGKTGTTNDYDAWFVGFDGLRTIAVWVGSDRNTRPLGRGEHGATVALPVFEDYYRPFARLLPDDEAPGPLPGPPPAGVEYVRIDPQTGLRAPAGEWGEPYPFLKGTAPLEFSPTRGTKQAQKIDELIYDF